VLRVDLFEHLRLVFLVVGRRESLKLGLSSTNGLKASDKGCDRADEDHRRCDCIKNVRHFADTAPTTVTIV
jgi:hypothetical protein